ncbi:MAG: hypothetical protein QOJ91_787 [Sphingomonadales bacterium]|jgi:hypothetical protein|nr:hypothetical protein [Sphingomonadales bacterium]
MVQRVFLTPEYVDALHPPPAGEAWIADAAVRGFGVRLWAGKGGGNAAYAIRVRDRSGRIVREAFSIWSDQSWRARDKAYELIKSGNLDLPLGAFLEEAREWARDRLATLRGRLSRAERRSKRYQQASDLVRSYTLEKMADSAFRRLERTGRKEDYRLQLIKLFDQVPRALQNTLMIELNVREIANAVADPALPFGQSRALQAFIGQLYKRAYRWHAPIGRRGDAISRRVSYLRRNQGAPHPTMDEISHEELQTLFQKLEREEAHWRQALAIRLYFETGAKMRRVMQARQSHIIDGVWYPYLPAERRLWFMGRERLNPEAQRIISLASDRRVAEGRSSDYLFPSAETDYRPIRSVWRYWSRICGESGWSELPLSHVVWRYREPNTPSYIYMCYRFFDPLQHSSLDPDVVSKLSNFNPESTNASAG